MNLYQNNENMIILRIEKIGCKYMELNKTSIANCNSNHTIYLPLIFWHEELPHINAHVQFLIWQRQIH